MEFGKMALINLYKCNSKLIRDKKYIRKFFPKICKIIQMELHGKCKVQRFGKGKLNGISAFQFIKTSSITIHFDERENRAFIDIFSCKDFNEKKAEIFSKKYFQANNSSSKVIKRK